jgi:hypothetical protein
VPEKTDSERNPLLITTDKFGNYTLTRKDNPIISTGIGDHTEITSLATAMSEGWEKLLTVWAEVTNSPLKDLEGQVINNERTTLPPEDFFYYTNAIKVNDDKVFGYHVPAEIEEWQVLTAVLERAGRALKAYLDGHPR